MGRTYKPSGYDLRLALGANCVDAGTTFPQVTNNHNGAAPDLGCYELGQNPPHYGPRR